MERHITDHPRSDTTRLARYLREERAIGLRGPHHAINVLRRLPRGSGSASRVRSYLRIDREG